MDTDLSMSSFLAALQEQWHAQPNLDFNRKGRISAWEKFNRICLPQPRSDGYTHVPLRQLYALKVRESASSNIIAPLFEDFIYPACARSFIVFVDGIYRPDLSQRSALPENMLILPLTEGFRRFATFFSNRWAQVVKDETNPWALLNSALYSEGALIYLPPKVEVAVPLQVLYIQTEREGIAFTFPRLQCFVGKGSALSLIQTEKSTSSGQTIQLSYCDAVIEEGAQLTIENLSLCKADDWSFATNRFHLKERGVLSHVSFDNGAKALCRDVKVQLSAPHASVNLKSAALLKEQRHFHTHVKIHHQAPNCRSNQLFKFVLADQSRASFQGQIHVDPLAQQTDAFQLTNSLMLSDQALAHARPNLEIFADDVKASHGATAGPIDREALFYLRARGISQVQAHQLIARGFFEDSIDQFKLESVKAEINSWLETHLN